MASCEFLPRNHSSACCHMITWFFLYNSSAGGLKYNNKYKLGDPSAQCVEIKHSCPHKLACMKCRPNPSQEHKLCVASFALLFSCSAANIVSRTQTWGKIALQKHLKQINNTSRGHHHHHHHHHHHLSL